MKTASLILLPLILLSGAIPDHAAQAADEALDFPSLLSLFSAHAVPGGNVRINWILESQSPRILQFRLYRGYEDVGNFDVIADVPPHAANGSKEYSYTDTNVLAGVSYYYKIAAVDQSNESVFPVVISATVQTAGDSLGKAEQRPLMILPGKRVALYVRNGGHVQLSALSNPSKALVDDSLRPGIYEFDWSAAKPVTLRLHHENGYTAEVVWPVQ